MSILNIVFHKCMKSIFRQIPTEYTQLSSYNISIIVCDNCPYLHAFSDNLIVADYRINTNCKHNHIAN
jgi:hypothetical protein